MTRHLLDSWRRDVVTSRCRRSLVALGGLGLLALTGCDSSAATTTTTKPELAVGSSSCIDLTGDVSSMVDDGSSPIESTGSMDLERATIDSDGTTLRLTWTTVGALDTYDPSRPGSGVSVTTEMRWTLDDAWTVSVNELNGVPQVELAPTTGGVMGSTDHHSATVTVAADSVTVTAPVSALPGLPQRFVWRSQVFGLQGTPLNGLPYFSGRDQCGTTMVNNSDSQPFWGHAVFPGDVVETSREPLQANAAVIPNVPASAPATEPSTALSQPSTAAPVTLGSTTTETEAASTSEVGTLPTPTLPDAPWTVGPVPAPTSLGSLPEWWYRWEEPETGCSLLAPTASPEDLGATGPPDDPMVGTAGGGPFIAWPGADAPWMAVYEPPLDGNDPALQQYFAADTNVTSYADGSEERVANGKILVTMPGVGCAYEFGTSGPMASTRTLFSSLRIIEAPTALDPTTTTSPPSEVPAPEACPKAGRDVMREGDGVPTPCDSVTHLQQLLDAAGYPVAVDGRFGSGTADAVRAFQQDHGLTADGLVGPRTWTALLDYETDF